jgi:hypothetical protein
LVDLDFLLKVNSTGSVTYLFLSYDLLLVHEELLGKEPFLCRKSADQRDAHSENHLLHENMVSQLDKAGNFDWISVMWFITRIARILWINLVSRNVKVFTCGKQQK